MQDQKISSWSQTQSNGPCVRTYKLGYEVIPWWFKQKIEDGTVEMLRDTKDKRRLSGCRFYDTRGNERMFPTGSIIYSDMLYTEEPKRK